jgi:phosphate starvation-inducible PhoH-like protein
MKYKIRENIKNENIKNENIKNENIKINKYFINMENLENDEKQKKQRRPRNKKQNEKELLNMYFVEKKEEEDKKEKEYIPKQVIDNIKYLSPYEKSKLENKFTKPKNKNQELYISMLKNKNKKIIIVTGPAGTGKTMFATEYGISNFLTGKYDKLVFTRPSVSVDEDLGYLPGNLEEKMAPWIRPIYDVLYQFISPKEVIQLMEEKFIEIAPLGFMRGRTFKNTWIVADEMQNSTISQMKMLLTRLGENSRLIITGDLEQFDKPDMINGLDDFLNKFRGKRSLSISSFEFERNDIQREEVVKEILEIYSGDEIPKNYIDENII